MKTNKLPVGFRYLLTKREIKALEAQTSIRFVSISFSHLLDSQTLIANQATIHPVSLWGRKEANEWLFSINQSGFRNELLSNQVDVEVKANVILEISNYLHKAATFVETDFIKRPQLWIYITLNQAKAEVKSREPN